MGAPAGPLRACLHAQRCCWPLPHTQVVEKQAEDELEWDVASMLGEEEGDKFFVRSTLNYFEYDQVGSVPAQGHMCCLLQRLRCLLPRRPAGQLTPHPHPCPRRPSASTRARQS